ERGEEIAEAFLGVSLFVRDRAAAALRATGARTAAAEFVAAAPVRRRPELLPRLPLAPELIVRRALLRILEHLVGLLHFLEALLGVLLLADVRMEFAGEPPVRGLHLLGGRRALHAQNLVVVAEFHERFYGAGPPASQRSSDSRRGKKGAASGGNRFAARSSEHGEVVRNVRPRTASERVRRTSR